MVRDYDFRDFAGAAARAFNTLRFEPDKGLNQALQTIQQQRTANRAKNKTVEYLKGLGTPMGNRLAAMVGTGQLKGADAYKLMFDIESEQRAAARASSAADLAFQRQMQLADAGRDFTSAENIKSRQFQLEKMLQEEELLRQRQELTRGADFENRVKLMELQNSLGIDLAKIKSQLSTEQAKYLADYNFKFKKELLGLSNQYGMERDAAKAALTPNAKEAEINRIMKSFNLSRADAVGLVDGVIKIIPNNVTGIAEKYNVATNERTEFKPANISDLEENLGIESKKTGDESTGIFADTDATEALGLSGFGKNVVNKISDAIVGRMPFDEAGDANAALRKLQADTVLAATVEVEGRPSNFTRQMVLDNYTIDPSSPSTGVADAIKKSRLMVRALEDTVKHYQDIVSGKTKVKPESVSLATEELPKVKRYLADYKSLLESLQGNATIQSAPNLSSDEIDLINRNLPNEQKLNVTTPQFVPTAD